MGFSYLITTRSDEIKTVFVFPPLDFANFSPWLDLCLQTFIKSTLRVARLELVWNQSSTGSIQFVNYRSFTFAVINRKIKIEKNGNLVRLRDRNIILPKKWFSVIFQFFFFFVNFAWKLWNIRRLILNGYKKLSLGIYF